MDWVTPPCLSCCVDCKPLDVEAKMNLSSRGLHYWPCSRWGQGLGFRWLRSSRTPWHQWHSRCPWGVSLWKDLQEKPESQVHLLAAHHQSGSYKRKSLFTRPSPLWIIWSASQRPDRTGFFLSPAWCYYSLLREGKNWHVSKPANTTTDAVSRKNLFIWQKSSKIVFFPQPSLNEVYFTSWFALAGLFIFSINAKKFQFWNA